MSFAFDFERTPQKRLQNGKNPTARITFQTTKMTDELIIICSNDGRGIFFNDTFVKQHIIVADNISVKILIKENIGTTMMVRIKE